MSNQDQGPEPTMEFEIVGGVPASPTGSARRHLRTFVAAGVGVAAVGAGVWAWQAWAAQGPQPAQALPGSTLAYAALDLDPPGGQKLAAYNTLRRFPSLKRELGLGSAEDLTKSVVDELASGSNCDLDYRQVEPWMGDRIAVAVVKQTRLEPVVVLQVSDADKARTGLKSVSDRCDGAGFGYVVDGEWAVLARNVDVAAQVTQDAERGTLSDDKQFRRLTGDAGDPGLVTLFAAPEVGKALLGEMEKNPFVVWGTLLGLNSVFDPISAFLPIAGLAFTPEPDFNAGEGYAEEYPANVSPELKKAEAELDKRFEHFDELSPKEQKRLMREQSKLFEKMYGPLEDGSLAGESAPEEDFAGEGPAGEVFPDPDLDPALRSALQSFTGLGGVARFAGSGLEVEIVGDSLQGAVGDMYAGSAGDDIVSRLPADSAIAFGTGLADGWVDSLMTQLNQQVLFAGTAEADTVKAFEEATGLDVPGDVEALGGERISIVAGSGLDPDTLFDAPAQTPVAVRIGGDPGRIEAALDKLRARLGSDGGPQLLSRRVGDDVIVGTDADYLDHVAEGGHDLGDSKLFQRVVPDADKATAVYFADFDAGDWLAKAVGSDEDRRDVEPLEAAGLTVTKHGGDQRLVFRLSFED